MKRAGRGRGSSPFSSWLHLTILHSQKLNVLYCSWNENDYANKMDQNRLPISDLSNPWHFCKPTNTFLYVPFSPHRNEVLKATLLFPFLVARSIALHTLNFIYRMVLGCRSILHDLAKLGTVTGDRIDIHIDRLRRDDLGIKIDTRSKHSISCTNGYHPK